MPVDEKAIAQIKQDQLDGKCTICHKSVEQYTSKKNKTYTANPDHSPHRKKKGIDFICVNNWDEFNGLKNDFIVEESKLKRTDLLDTPKTRELKIEDMVAGKLRSEIQVNLAVLKIYEEEVISFLKKNGDANPNPAKVGMYMKLLREDKNE